MTELRIKKPLFGKEAEIIVYDVDETIARDIIEEALELGLKLEKIFNIFDNSSEISQLNKNRKIIASEELVELLKYSLEMCKKVKDYDVTLGKQFLQRKGGQEIIKLNCSAKDVKIKGNFVELLHPDVLIDLGSVAKGYIADRLVEFLQSKGIISGLVDARGDIRVFGKENIIKIQHPRQKNKSLATLNTKNLAIATSGDYNQYSESFNESHIINSKDFISVTVIAPTLKEADIYATAIFVTPKENIQKLLKNKNISVMVTDKDLNTTSYNNFEEYIQ